MMGALLNDVGLIDRIFAQVDGKSADRGARIE
jgi:hypothetical protein